MASANVNDSGFFIQVQYRPNSSPIVFCIGIQHIMNQLKKVGR